MAEEDTNHAKVEGSLLGQSFVITTKDVLSLVLVGLMALAGWFAWQSNERRLDIMQSHHLKLIELVLEQKELTRDETATILKALTIVNYNIHRPADAQIPLGINGTPAPGPKTPAP